MPNPDNYDSMEEFIAACIRQVNSEEDKRDWPRKRKLGYCYGLWENRESKKSLNIMGENDGD